MDTNASDTTAPAKTDPTKGHSRGPFFVTKDTVITTDRDAYGDVDCPIDKREWIGEFYGSERAAADAALACRAMNSHEALVKALREMGELLEYAKSSELDEYDIAAAEKIINAALKLARGEA